VSAVKHVLVYADGRIVDAGTELLGNRFIRHEMVDGDLWEREFQVDWATSGHHSDPTCTMVALERTFVLKRTAKQLAQEHEEHRAKVMKQVLDGVLGK
jgi:hypothetical protein